MVANCFRFAPRDSVPGLIAKICGYLKDHPGWSEEELEEQIRQFIGRTGVESFNGRIGEVTLNVDDVNKLKIASAYFAEGNESISELDIAELYNQGVRFVFTNWNELTSGYDLTFVLEYFSGSDEVVYYPMATGSGGGSIISVNGKTGIVDLNLSDILGDSGAQVKLCSATEFTSTTLTTWNAYYEDGYRIVGVVNSDATAIDYIYLLKQDMNNHRPIGLSAGVTDAYSPSNPPPYPVTSVNGKTGAVSGLYGADAPPPYPVTSVNGATGAVSIRKGFARLIEFFGQDGNLTRVNIGPFDRPGNPCIDVGFNDGRIRVWDGTSFISTAYTSKQPPPYPVTSVFGLTGNVKPSVTSDITEAEEGTLAIDFPQLGIAPLGGDEGTLPSGNSLTRYIILEKPLESGDWAKFIAVPRKTGVTVTIDQSGSTLSGNGYLQVKFEALGAEAAPISRIASFMNLSEVSHKIIGYTRYIP